jgi:DNA-directed RNA polymerase subunit RPC12/RpoP
MSVAAQHSTPSIPLSSSATASSRTSSAKSNRMIYIRDEHGHFVCPTCGIVKKNQSTMHYHMKTHEDAMEFKCNTCKKEFIHAQALKIHMDARHGKSKGAKAHSCPVRDCPFESSNKGNCRTHFLRMHCTKETAEILDRDMETGTISCTSCGIEFGSLSAFYYHTVLCIDLPATDGRAKMLESLL